MGMNVITEKRIVLRAVKAAAPWEAYLLPVSGFGIPEEELIPVKAFLQQLTATLLQDGSLSLEVFIQLMQLHWGGGPERLAAHGREWLPMLGLGVWPDREPPRFWTMEDFKNVTPGEKPRTLMDQIFRISTTIEARLDACSVLLGLGTIVQMMTVDSSDVFLERARSVLLSPITDPSYTCFPFYLPLLEAKSIASHSAEEIETWLCGASVYVRESKQDNGILIVSRDPLRGILNELRTHPSADAHYKLEIQD